MFTSPEQVFIFLFSIVAAISATCLWNCDVNKKTDPLGKVDQQLTKYN